MSKKAIFIHCPRTGGNSIRDMFAGHLYNYGHVPAASMRSMLGDIWGSVWSFGMVRNPWDRVVSLYYRTSYTDRARRGIFEDSLPWQRADFRRWFTDPHFRTGHTWYIDLKPARLFAGTAGECIVDDLFLFEKLELVFSSVSDYLGVEVPRLQQKTSPLPKYHYSELIDADIRDDIAEWGGWEISRFGYSF